MNGSHQASGGRRLKAHPLGNTAGSKVGWWPFKRREVILDSDPHIRGTRVWLTDLRDICERNFNSHTEGQRLLRELQVEWKEAHELGEVPDELLEGLERRTYRLLRADAEQWLGWLDDDEFWLPGWRGDDGAPGTSGGMD